MITARVERKGDAQAVLDRIRESVAGPVAVKVGFPAGMAGSDMVSRAVYNEFGTAGSGKGFSTPRGGGFGGPIPERPFFRNAMADNKERYRSLSRTLARDVIRGERAMPAALDIIGKAAQGHVRQSITDLRTPPNSPVTTAIKGSANPLVDKGGMHQAVTWVLVDE